MIATASIPADTLLIYTPASLILSSGDGDSCHMVEEIIHELKMGFQSKWQTHFDFDDSVGSRLPTLWDRANGPGRAKVELQGLPPTGETHSHIDWYLGSCKEGRAMTHWDWKALMIYVTRSAGLGIIPMYVLLNHHNGRINTKLVVDEEGGLSVIALTDISAKEPIYLT